MYYGLEHQKTLGILTVVLAIIGKMLSKYVCNTQNTLLCWLLKCVLISGCIWSIDYWLFTRSHCIVFGENPYNLFDGWDRIKYFKMAMFQCYRDYITMVMTTDTRQTTPGWWCVPFGILFYTMKNAQLITSRHGFVGRKHRQLKLDEALKGNYTDFSNIIQHEMHLTSRCRLLRCGWWFNV